jgi:S1-C subfamily serine protease
MFRYMVAVPLLLAAMSAQNAPTTNKGRLLDIPAISRQANGSIVSIVMSDKDGHPLAQGSGFLVSKNGHVVTNYHVIKSGTSAVVKLPDGAFFAVDGVLASNKDRDVAIIKAHGNDFRTLTLGDSNRLQVGEEVVAIGNPLSLESTVSNGIVSAIRTVEDEGGKFVQITAPISPGSSGGPLFNMAGEVVGITTSHLIGGQNLNFAIPINDAKPLLAVPASQALLALPNEPEAAPVRTEATARTDNANPSLEETEQWMKDNTDLRHVTFGVQQAVTIYADSYEVVNLGTGNVDYPKDGGSIYVERLPGFVDNINDGKSHRWQRIRQQYDLSFDGCLMTVEHLKEIITSTGVALNADTPGDWTLLDTHTFDLQHYNPQIVVREQMTTADAYDPTYKTILVPKGTAYINPTALITASSTSRYNELPIFFEVGYSFADRFAKALQHAITLCGGKTESF